MFKNFHFVELALNLFQAIKLILLLNLEILFQRDEVFRKEIFFMSLSKGLKVRASFNFVKRAPLQHALVIILLKLIKKAVNALSFQVLLWRLLQPS
jgi:hypothetical protein